MRPKYDSSVCQWHGIKSLYAKYLMGVKLDVLLESVPPRYRVTHRTQLVRIFSKVMGYDVTLRRNRARVQGYRETKDAFYLESPDLSSVEYAAPTHTVPYREDVLTHDPERNTGYRYTQGRRKLLHSTVDEYDTPLRLVLFIPVFDAVAMALDMLCNHSLIGDIEV